MKTNRKKVLSAIMAVQLLISSIALNAPAAAEQDIGQRVQELTITELMPKNKSVLMAPDGGFYDWIELRNDSGTMLELSGWSIVKNGKSYPIISDKTLQPGEYTVVYAAGAADPGASKTAFRFGPGDSIALESPDGRISGEISGMTGEINISFIPEGSGEVRECRLPTPGYENTVRSYDLINESSAVSGPLVINEIMGCNIRTQSSGHGFDDWIEIKNISDSPVLLSDYWLSDDPDELRMTRLPAVELAPSALYVIWCSGSSANTTARDFHADFKINSRNEAVYLSGPGGIVDYAAFRDVLEDQSMGRMEGMDGWFILRTGSPGRDNRGGIRRYSAMPEASGRDGVFNGVDSVTVELSAPGVIRYTTDGSTPGQYSNIYNGPIELTKTAVLRCVAIEEGLPESRELVLSYFINENFTFPVLSIVGRDSWQLNGMYWNFIKGMKLPATAALYESDGGFKQDCAVYMKGNQSGELPKKSMGIAFTGRYGGGKLEYDVFDNGNTGYESLSVRAGQDYTFAMIRNELMQELCMSYSDRVLTQHTKYCILYVNGDYRGIYCLKEEISRGFYAMWSGSDKKDVTGSAYSPEFREEVVGFIRSHDMSDDANYRELCSILDIDSLIDWIVIEGYSANTDIGGNVRYYKTQGGKWQLALYDLDWALTTEENARNPFGNILADGNIEICNGVIFGLLRNREFCDELCRRAVELLRGPLNDYEVLKKIDRMLADIEPDLPRDRTRWDLTMQIWNTRCNGLKAFITDNNWAESCIQAVFRFTGASDELKAEFGY